MYHGRTDTQIDPDSLYPIKTCLNQPRGLDMSNSYSRLFGGTDGQKNKRTLHFLPVTPPPPSDLIPCSQVLGVGTVMLFFRY